MPRFNDPITPIRVPSIRGHLRQWWRATAHSAQYLDAGKLRERESEIFGDTSHPGKLRISVSITSPGAIPQAAELNFRDRDRLFPVFPADLNNIKKDIAFQLTLRFSPEHKADIDAAVWAWVNFGGIGAKTRRGCGALYCETLAPALVNGQLVFSQWKQHTSSVSPTLPWPRLAWLPFVRMAPSGEAIRKPMVAWREAIETYRNFRRRGPSAIGLTSFEGLGFAGHGRMASPMILRPVAWGNGTSSAPMVLLLRVDSGSADTPKAQTAVAGFVKTQGYKMAAGS